METFYYYPVKCKKDLHNRPPHSLGKLIEWKQNLDFLAQTLGVTGSTLPTRWGN